MGSVKQLCTELKATKVPHAPEEEDWGGFNAPHPLIPEGIYDVVFLRAHKFTILKTIRLLTIWKICQIGCEQHGVELPMGIQLPKNGKKKFGQFSKMADMFRIATGKDPDRYDRISARVFKSKIFSADVQTVKGKRYSKIERLIAKQFGPSES